MRTTRSVTAFLVCVALLMLVMLIACAHAPAPAASPWGALNPNRAWVL